MSGTIFANQRASCGDLDDAERGDSSGGQQANGHVQGNVGVEGEVLTVRPGTQGNVVGICAVASAEHMYLANAKCCDPLLPKPSLNSVR